MPGVICISASGKVLLAGGYLVLDPEYSGTVVAASSRFFTILRPSSSQLSEIIVRSPQFYDALWNYSVSIESGVSLESNLANSNKFVEAAIRETLSLGLAHYGSERIQEWLRIGLEIVIAGDNDFYSQRNRLASLGLSPTLENSQSLERFADTGTTLKNAHKTGLGSSAALITSLVASLLVYLRLAGPEAPSGSRFSEKALALIHNTSQYVHCLAQGKVGSGFDVASAVYGSHLYTRFDPSVIKPLMASTRPPPAELLNVLSPSNIQWNQRVRPFHLPPRTRLMLADVSAGSDTPSLVNRVLKWRAENAAQAKQLWDTIASLNERFTEALHQLAKLSQEEPLKYGMLMRDTAESSISTWGTSGMSKEKQQIVEVKASAEEIRRKMKLMGELSDVPIEPAEQTRLLDACMSKPGVIAGGVPGAGGYDAVWLLLAEPEDMALAKRITDEVQKLWLSWTEMAVTPLPATESRVSGLKIEVMSEVAGIQNLLEKCQY
ncbi:phosphomevalonate kinase [Cantharellus anzutake]|uniref:phosphomevalonate kinase n=1 Tax=Cantharellus anzutake TaxID=1750568 RepID=UPI001907BEC0|nr:phosphomevalonate kinase [Cantharellus anzutake]KAF8332650.1 phosphomevalonate kinase [Cantharellus anzutake]